MKTIFYDFITNVVGLYVIKWSLETQHNFFVSSVGVAIGILLIQAFSKEGK